MALKFIKHTWQKVVLISLLTLTVLVLLLAFVINIYWSPILAGKVKAAVTKGTDSLYKIDFADAELHILKGEIIIYDIHFRPDTAVYNRHKKQNLAPNNLTELYVKRLVLSHIHPFKLYFKKVLDIDKIILSAPDVRISYELNHIKDTATTDYRTAWQKMSKTLKSARVGQILLNDVKLRYEDNSGPKQAVSEFKELNVLANELLIDSTTQADTSRLLYCKDIAADLHNYKGKTADGLYDYSINSLKFSTFKSQLIIAGFTWDAVKDYYSKSQKDRFKVQLDTLQLNNFDFLTYHKYRKLSASSLVLTRGTIDVFKHPNKPRSYKNKVKSYPNIAIYNVNADIKIDTILINRINVIYGELNKKSGKTGAITFNNTNGRFLNVTTNKAALQKNNISHVKLTTYFLNRGKFDVSFAFNLTDKAASYSYKGKLGAMDLEDVNQATIPFAMVKITSGKLKEFTFDIKGDNKGASGRVQLLYTDLKVKLLKADTAQKTLKRKTIASLFANVFIIEHNNPDNPGEAPRVANVVYKRPVEFPFFKTVWKTLLAGIKPNIGLNEKAQQATAALTQKSLNKKLDRKTKKTLRIQKRAERKKQRQLKRAQKEAAKAKEEQKNK